MTRIPLVDLKAQFLTIRTEIEKAISSVIESTAFVGFKDNSFLRTFENAFAEFTKVSHCVGCANGTDSIELILKALGIGPGDEVLVPANTWISTSEAVTSVGAKPVFVDVLKDFYTIDPSQLKRWTTSKTKAIIPVHLFGLPAEMDEILEFAKKQNLHVVEDCAQAHGAEYRGTRVGAFGVAASFSFYPGKNLGAYGDAGAVVTSNEGIAERVRLLGNHGRSGKFDHSIEGRNSRLDGLQAAILSAKLPFLSRWTEQRVQNAALYDRYLKPIGLPLPMKPGHSKHVFHLYVTRVKNRAAVQERLKERGIETGIHYPVALPATQAYRYMNLDLKDYPVALNASEEILSLPMYPELTEDQIAYVAQCLREVCS